MTVSEMTDATNVLIVDDNRNYRQAFSRNLLLEGYEVFEAEDSDEALRILSEQPLDVVVTDLAMRHPTEGLDLIRQARAVNPHMPIIMISAVGTFEEGAEASRLGARFVISKSKIDEEMDNLFTAIHKAVAEYKENLKHAAAIAQLRLLADADPAGAASKLRQFVTRSDVGETVKGEAYDALLEINSGEMLQTTREERDRVQSNSDTQVLIEKAEINLRKLLRDFDKLEHDTQEALRTAEFLYVHGEQLEKMVDFSRSIGFSYCFAVENEAKARLRKRLQKFFNENECPRLIKSLMEDNKKSLSIFFHQHLLRIQREQSMEITIDNVYQTFQRILEHGGKYKPDGLKALGIVLLCFGRNYEFRKFQQVIKIENPLGLKGFEADDDVLRFATLLTQLQHFRNPYIHPEISDMEKLSSIRDTSFDCINLMTNIV